MLCECMKSVPSVSYALTPYTLTVRCAARGKGGVMLRGRIWQCWASTIGMTWPRIDGNGGPPKIFCPRPNPFVSPCGYIVASVVSSSPSVVFFVIQASVCAANLYQNREVADHVLPASAGPAVREVLRSTSASSPRRSPRYHLRLRSAQRCPLLLLRRLVRRPRSRLALLCCKDLWPVLPL